MADGELTRRGSTRDTRATALPHSELSKALLFQLRTPLAASNFNPHASPSRAFSYREVKDCPFLVRFSDAPAELDNTKITPF